MTKICRSTLLDNFSNVSLHFHFYYPNVGTHELSLSVSQPLAIPLRPSRFEQYGEIKCTILFSIFNLIDPLFSPPPDSSMAIVYGIRGSICKLCYSNTYLTMLLLKSEYYLNVFYIPQITHPPFFGKHLFWLYKSLTNSISMLAFLHFAPFDLILLN